MRQQDMQINRSIDRILVRQDIKTQKLKYRNTNGRVYFQGELVKRHGKDIEDKDELKQLEQRISRIEGVMTVEWDLKNWKKEHGQWKKKDRDKTMKSQMRSSSQDIQLDW